jgi:hypothetical protein
MDPSARCRPAARFGRTLLADFVAQISHPEIPTSRAEQCGQICRGRPTRVGAAQEEQLPMPRPRIGLALGSGAQLEAGLISAS